MHEHPAYHVQNMTLQQVEMAAQWAAKEGWNPGIHDARIFYNTDPQGFLIGLDGQEPVAVISAVRYGDQFGFIGFYIARPDLRNEGYGFRMGREAMRRCHDINTGLDGVLDKVDQYGKIGFKLAYRNGRFRGLSRPASVDKRLVPVAQADFKELMKYDRQMFPAERPGFMRMWIDEPAHRGVALLDAGRIRGFGIVRPCQIGYKIGPLFADNEQIAQTIFDGLTGPLPVETEVFWDTPMCNKKAVGLAQAMGMTVVFETARMYSQGAPDIDLDRLFGVTTFELG